LDLLKGHQGTAFDKIDPVTPNVPRYPERALQEAVVNALVHRNYESNEPVRITVFSDRVEVRSPGALPRTVPADKFKEGRAAPSWRNQALAYFFNKLQLAQAEGQGIPTILRTMKEAGSPNPWFDLEEEAVICVLPAHARHEILRQLTGIENDLILGNYDDGHSRLLVVLESWPRHSKALAVLAQSARLRNRPEDVEKFIRKHGINPSEIEAGTVYQLAQVLLDCASNYARELAKKWFEFASQQRLKTDEVKSVTLGLRKLGKNEEAIRVINKHLEEGLIGATTASLYDIRGRARIDLAKRCTETARRHGISWALKKRAWDECRQFIELAEKDFARALELVTSPTEREFIEKDLTFVQTMRTQVRRPERRRGPRPG
jgi:predicted HTH transcriptional regulator